MSIIIIIIHDPPTFNRIHSYHSILCSQLSIVSLHIPISYIQVITFWNTDSRSFKAFRTFSFASLCFSYWTTTMLTLWWPCLILVVISNAQAQQCDNTFPGNFSDFSAILMDQRVYLTGGNSVRVPLLLLPSAYICLYNIHHHHTTGYNWRMVTGSFHRRRSIMSSLGTTTIRYIIIIIHHSSSLFIWCCICWSKWFYLCPIWGSWYNWNGQYGRLQHVFCFLASSWYVYVCVWVYGWWAAKRERWYQQQPWTPQANYHNHVQKCQLLQIVLLRSLGFMEADPPKKSSKLVNNFMQVTRHITKTTFY